MSINFFGTKISWICEQGQLTMVNQFIKSNTPKYITYSNVHVVVTSKNNEMLRNAINSADLASPDGMPLVYFGRKHGAHCVEKCSGPDMLTKVIENGLDEGYKHYFYGSKQDTLDELENQLTIRYPEINIVGKYSPPFRKLLKEEDLTISEEINRLSPDCIWIGLGAPKQEIWMLEHKNALNRGVMFGVGAAFDFHAGKLKRAPVWMQVYSLEWLYRLVKEPRRLFRRYFKTNVLFLWYLLRHEIVVSYKHTCQKEK